MMIGANETDTTVWFPGGEIHIGETPRNTAVRELKEESGFKAEPEDLVQIDNFVTGDHKCAVFALRIKAPPHKVLLRSKTEAAKKGHDFLCFLGANFDFH